MTRLSIRDQIEAQRAINDLIQRDFPDLRAEPDSHAEHRPRRRLGGLVAAALLLLVAGGTGYALYHFATLGVLMAEFLESRPAQNPQTIASTEPQTPFDEHVAEAGIRTCAKLFPDMGRILTHGSVYGVNMQWNDSSPDAHPVQAIAGMKFDLPDYAGQAAGVVFASPVGDLCEGNLIRVVPMQKTCEDVVKTLPEGSKLSDTLAGSPLYDLGPQPGQTMLIPSGAVCVVVTVAQIAEQR